MAKLGYRSLIEIVGRGDLLQPRENVNLTKAASLNLSALTTLPDTREDRAWLTHEAVHSNGPVLDDDILAKPAIQAAIEQQMSVTLAVDILNTDRTVGARIAGAIAKQIWQCWI